MDPEVIDRLDRIEGLLNRLVERQKVQDWYTTEEFGKVVGKSEHTIRDHCRFGRIRAVKRKSGRGAYAGWSISHEELLRYQKEGLLPDRRL